MCINAEAIHKIGEVRPCRVVHRSSRAERASGWTATKQGCDPGRSGRMGGEVIVRKNAPPRRRTTRSGIIFYEGIVSVLYIGSLTTRCSVAGCALFLHPVLSPPCHRHRVEHTVFPLLSLSHTVSVIPTGLSSSSSETSYRFSFVILSSLYVPVPFSLPTLCQRLKTLPSISLSRFSPVP